MKILLLLLCLCQAAYAGDFEDALAAAQNGDYQTAYRLFKPFAEQGNADAQYDLGQMYYKGQGVTQDYKEAAKWYRMSAELGVAGAQFSLGYMYSNGKGVTRDYKEAVKWYRLAAEQGNAKAQYNLAFMYENGKGVTQDYKVAVKWYRLAAEQGVAEAQNNLGVRYATGQGVIQDYIQAYAWWNLAVLQGNEDAIENRDRVAEMMTREQIARAQSLSRELSSRTQDSSPNQTASRQEEWSPSQTASRQEESSSRLDRRLVGEIQADLATLGYNPGPIDGKAGRKTIVAIKNYQSDNGIKPDGIISGSLSAWLKISLAMAASEQASEEDVSVSSGTGFAVGTGYVITNHHVISECQTIRVYLNNKPVIGEVTVFDESDDIAVIKVTKSTSALGAFKASGWVRLGEDVVVVGYPLRGLLSDDLNVSTGNVSALSGIGNDPRYLQISAPVQPGNSGGPLLDSDGNVIGMVVSKLNAINVAKVTGDIPQNVNFAIKAHLLKSFLDINGIGYETTSSQIEKSTEGIVDSARGFTVPIECHQ